MGIGLGFHSNQNRKYLTSHRRKKNLSYHDNFSFTQQHSKDKVCRGVCMQIDSLI